MRNYATILLIIFYLGGYGLFAQNMINGYAYWFDNDAENTVTVPIVGTETFELSTAVATTSLNTGLHVFNIQFWDDDFRHSSVLTQFFYKIPEQTVSAKEIIAYEFWIDNDYENAVIQSITPTQQFALAENIPFDALNTGLHVITIRFKDNTNVWSSACSQFFYKTPGQSVSSIEIIEYEYWIDDDHANAVSQSVTPAQVFVLEDDIDLNTLNTGLHAIHFRFKDNNQVWSSPVSRFLYKNPVQTVSSKQIIAYELWIDGDYANAISESIAPGDEYSLSQGFDLASLHTGLHVITVRFKDNTGAWSGPLSQFIIKKRVTNGEINEMIAYRHWFDEDFEAAVSGQFSPASTQAEFINSIDMSQLWKGEHSLQFQFKDASGEWSVVSSDVVIKESLPIADFEFSSAYYCDSTVVTTQNNSIDGFAYLWDFGDGSTSSDVEPSHAYTQAGEYTISLTASDPDAGLDSVMTLPVIITSGNSASIIEAVVCDIFTSPSGNYSWTESGVFWDTIPNAAGCDSVITVNLTILNSSASAIEATACDSYVSPSGEFTWEESGTYTDILENAAGCDSVITVNLTILNSSFATIEETSCGDYISPSGNYTWSESGLYSDTLVNYSGCDSVITVDLTVNTVDTSVTNQDPVLIANATGATYQWIDCGTMLPIPGETGQNFTATSNGFYAVEVTQNDCVDTSGCYPIMSVGLDESPDAGIVVFPNPTDGQVTIKLDQVYNKLELIVRDDKGRLIASSMHHSTNKVILELNNSKGFYFIDLISDSVLLKTIKVLKN